MTQIILPLGISFFTFTQIAFLVDTYQGKAREYNFIHYALFVTYFPHLIAGPVLHHKEMMPQFAHAETYRLRIEKIVVGSTIFFIGLFKKVVLADGVAPYANQAFDAATAGDPLQFFQAWGGALAYTMQLYFDFSGYSDMAIGLSLLFGIALPLNFNSPYKAVNIIEFWRRWHMTLSRFLRDYLYIPLGGNRKGWCAAIRQSRRHDAAWRAMARCGLDICPLGWTARLLRHYQSCMARPAGKSWTGSHQKYMGGTVCGNGHHIFRRCRGLGVLPRFQLRIGATACSRPWLVCTACHFQPYSLPLWAVCGNRFKRLE